MPAKPYNQAEYRLKGLGYLQRYMNGESVSQISRTVKDDRREIGRCMRKAAESLIESTQAAFIQEVLPKAIEVLKATLEKELEAIQAGKTPSTSVAERVLKGMYVLDSPSLKKSEGGGEEESEPQSIEAFVLRQKLKPGPRPKAIEGSVVKDGEEDNSSEKNRPPTV